VTVLRVGFNATAGGDSPADHDSEVMGCIRAVDEVGAVGECQYAVVLPHTDLAGGKIVAERIQGRLAGVGCTSVAVGVAQLQRDEEAVTLVARAEDACRQANTKGGGVLMAVDVM
jgi:PleD family two-component response regulator